MGRRIELDVIITEFFRKARNIRTLRIVALSSLPLFPVFCLFVMEYMNFGADMDNIDRFLTNHPLSALFNALAVLVIFGILLLICKKAVIAGGILGIISFLCAYINYMKVAVNGDNFFPRDIAMIRNLGGVMTFISGSLPPWFWGMLIIAVFWVFFLWFAGAEIRLSWKFRLPPAAAAIIGIIVIFFTPQRTNAVLDRFDMSLFDAALQSSNYTANGFTGGFIVNLLSMNVRRPSEYSRATINDLLDGFYATDGSGEYFDVIVVLSESFFDVRILPGTEFSRNPLQNWDSIISRPNAYSGLVYTTAINGGTIRPEFDILTGLTTDHLPSGSIPYMMMRREMPTHVSHYRDFGYRTIALHPYNERFYSRDFAYPLMGFDEFLGEDELISRFGYMPRNRIGFVQDVALMEPIRYFLDGSDEPMFMFVITMQNHQPFPPLPEEYMCIVVTNDRLEPDILSNVTTFTHGLNDADRMLGMLVDYIDGRERPTVLLFFGDHLPNLGSRHAALTQSGLVRADAFHRMETRKILYSTPFLIYSNRELLPFFPGNTDNHISTYYLLSAIAVMTDFHRTPYMNLLLSYHDRLPVHNVRLYQPVTDDILSLRRMMELITYDRLLGNLYSVR